MSVTTLLCCSATAFSCSGVERSRREGSSPWHVAVRPCSRSTHRSDSPRPQAGTHAHSRGCCIQSSRRQKKKRKETARRHTARAQTRRAVIHERKETGGRREKSRGRRSRRGVLFLVTCAAARRDVTATLICNSGTTAYEAPYSIRNARAYGFDTCAAEIGAVVVRE